MLTPEEIARLSAEEPTQLEGETAEQHAKRHAAWYGQYAYKFSKTTQSVIPTITIHTKKVA